MTNIYAHLADGDAPKNQHITEVSFVDETGKHVDISGGTTLTDLVLIGDSYGEGVGATDAAHGYANIVAKALNLTLHNYAIGGTGFNNQGASGNGRFDAQMQTAVNDTNYDHSKVKYIIVEGGTNDWGAIATAKEVTNTICSLAQSSFPNARLLFVLTQGVGPGSINLYPAVKVLNYRGIQEAAANYNNASVLRGDYWFNKWNASTYSSNDFIHPNDTGHQFIANKIVSALKYGDFQMTENLAGAYTQSYLTVDESQTDNITQFHSIIYFIGNGLCRLSAEFKYTVQEGDVDSSGTFYRINQPLLNFPDNVIINYPNISILDYFVTKLPNASGLQSRHRSANLYNGNNKPLKFAPGTISGLPANTAKAGDTLLFEIYCTFPYYGYAN